MKKRIRIIFTSAMLAFTLALMAFGVYAATSHTLSVNNYIQFDIGENITFTIEGKRTTPTGELGSRSQQDDAYYNQTNTQGGSAIEVGAGDADGTLTAWTMETPVKLYAGETITWTFTVTNKGQNPIYVNLGEFTNPWEENATLSAETNVTVPAAASGVGTSTEFVVTFKVNDTTTFENSTESEALNFNLTFDKDAKEKPATYDKLKFT